MLSSVEFVKQSLALHLFFARIMKEHAFFLQASLSPRDAAFANQAEITRTEFDKLLLEIISISNGLIDPEVIKSQELVTSYTLKAETASTFLTGIPIETGITQAESALTGGILLSVTPGLEQRIYLINQRAISLINEIINLKVRILTDVLVCKMFTHIYPTMLDHLIREARFYLESAQKLQRKEEINIDSEEYEQEAAWNRLMGEHAMFIRGLLDPTEVSLINTANNFANEFVELTEEARKAFEMTMPNTEITKESFDATLRLKDFKEQGTKGILDCKIKSMIMSLLSDHVLRESNHYLRLLRMFNK